MNQPQNVKPKRGRPKVNTLSRQEQQRRNANRYRSIKKLDQKYFIKAINDSFLEYMPILQKTLNSNMTDSEKLSKLAADLESCIGIWKEKTSQLKIKEKLTEI